MSLYCKMSFKTCEQYKTVEKLRRYIHMDGQKGVKHANKFIIPETE